MSNKWLAVALLGCGISSSPLIHAKDPEPVKAADAKPDKPRKDDDINLPAFPADKTVHQAVILDGRELKYEATVGSLLPASARSKRAGW